MTASSPTFLLLPEENSAIAADALARARALTETLQNGIVLPSTRHLREFVREQLAAVTSDYVVIFDHDEPPDANSIRAHLATLHLTGAHFSGPVFRLVTLRAALRAPLVDSETIYDNIGRDWLYFNFDSSPVGPAAQLLAALSPARSPRDALALLAFAHHLLCRCPIHPETEPLRRAAALRAIGAWHLHRCALPSTAAHALTAILHQAPQLSLHTRARTLCALFTTRFAPATTDRDLLVFCSEIEACIPGMFGGRALGEPTLQPSPP